MAYIVMAFVVMSYAVMAYIVMAYIVMAYIVMAYIVMAYIVMAYIAMPRSNGQQVTSLPHEKLVLALPPLHSPALSPLCTVTPALL